MCECEMCTSANEGATGDGVGRREDSETVGCITVRPMFHCGFLKQDLFDVPLCLMDVIVKTKLFSCDAGFFAARECSCGGGRAAFLWKSNCCNPRFLLAPNFLNVNQQAEETPLEHVEPQGGVNLRMNS